MRYTKKITKNYGCKMNDYMWKDNSYNHSRLGIDKLGLLEDIEEELGVDLVKLLSAKEIWYEYYRWIKGTFYVDFNDKCIVTGGEREDDIVLYFKDYGKTWFYTKEELKNGKKDR